MEREPRTVTNRISIGQAIGLILLIVVLVTLLLVDIDAFWKLGLVGVLAGVVIGILMFRRGSRGEEIVGTEPIGDVRINSASIPIRGGIGAGILIAILLIGVLLDVPALRWFALPGIVAGLIFGGALVLWRRYQGY